MWGEGATYGINGGFGSPEKKFSKVRAKFCFSLHYDYSNSYVFVNEQKVFMFKANNKNFNFPTQFCLENMSYRFGATDSRELCPKGNAYNFLVWHIKNWQVING